MKVLGIDIGGTGIKGAVVDTKKGHLVTDRLRLLTPDPATPDAVARTVAEIVKHFEWTDPIGCTYPGVVKDGAIHTAANLDRSWIGVDASALIGAATGCDVVVLNDADAAGLAEAAHGAARHQEGVVMAVTLGTGIGTALLIDGRLVPNTELGHLELNGGDAEKWAAASVRERLELDWDEWAARVDDYLRLVERLFWPDLFVIGGGVAKKPERFIPALTCTTKVVPARLQNAAGIVGAAMSVHHSHSRRDGDDKESKKKKNRRN